MQCIDAAEGLAKAIIHNFYQVYLDNRLDDTEYICNIKSVIEGTDNFLKKNSELISDPEILKQVLYSYAKKLWLENQYRIAASEKEKEGDLGKDGYYEYYFDYIYHHGDYPL